MKCPLPLIARHWGLAVLVSLGCFGAQAQEIVEVFRLSNQTVTAPANATVYVVDTINTVSERLSTGLPNTPAEAQKIATARLNALTAQDKEVLHQASAGVIRAAEYKITKAPAIVFDGQAVLYGLSDVEQARDIYRRWRARGG
jgi:integrating conjugative element protein (TIGR03757 family)